MLEDIVIDTNVMLHAQNPAESRFSSSAELLQCIVEGTTSLCVDEGFDERPERNRSFITAEYLGKLQFGSLGYAVVTQLAAQLRIKEVPRRAPQSVARRINQLIRNKTDRIFLGVAFNSQEGVLVSHDYTDFQSQKRTTIRTELKVRVLEAGECLPSLTEVLNHKKRPGESLPEKT